MKQPAVSIRTYTLVFVALLLLAGATTLIGIADLGPFSTPIAILIATAKAALIVVFFMQALNASRTVQIVIAAGVIWFTIMLTNTLGDYLTRGWLPFPGK